MTEEELEKVSRKMATLSDVELVEEWEGCDEAQRLHFERRFGPPAPLADLPDPNDWTAEMDECADATEVWDYSPSMGTVYSSEIDISEMPDLVMRDGHRLPRDLLRGVMAEFESNGLVQLAGQPAGPSTRHVLDRIDPRSGLRLWTWARSQRDSRYSEGCLNWGGHLLSVSHFVEWLEADIEEEWFEKLLVNHHGPGCAIFLAVFYDNRPRPLDLLEHRYRSGGFDSLDDWVEATVPEPVPVELLPWVYRWLEAAVRRGRRWSPEEWETLRQRSWFRHASESLLVSIRTAAAIHVVCRDDGEWIDLEYDVVECPDIESYRFVDRAELTADEHDRWAQNFYELERIQPYDQLVSHVVRNDPTELNSLVGRDFDLDPLPYPWQTRYEEDRYELGPGARTKACKTARGEVIATFRHVTSGRATFVAFDLYDSNGDETDLTELDPLLADRVIRDLTRYQVG